MIKAAVSPNSGHALINESVARPCSPDVYVGAYLISHLQARCENCNTPETPQWRKGWHSEILGRNVILCNACGLKYNKNQYCPYCYYVYYKEEDKKDIDSWVACDDCQRWVHIECEMKCGGHKDFNPFESYRCPSCRARPPKASKHGSHGSHGTASSAASSTASSAAASRHHRRSDSPSDLASDVASDMAAPDMAAPDMALEPQSDSADEPEAPMDVDAVSDEPDARLHRLGIAHNDKLAALGWRHTPLQQDASMAESTASSIDPQTDHVVA